MSSEQGTQTNKGDRDGVSPSSNTEDDPSTRESISGHARTTATMQLESNATVYSCLFEVFGIVQGVSFRMVNSSLILNYIFSTSFHIQYTLRRAQKLGVRGWCQNTKTNTVKGEIEGLFRAFEEMRLWLKYTGSPTSRIDKVIFGDTVEREQFTYESFSILME